MWRGGRKGIAGGGNEGERERVMVRVVFPNGGTAQHKSSGTTRQESIRSSRAWATESNFERSIRRPAATLAVLECTRKR